MSEIIETGYKAEDRIEREIEASAESRAKTPTTSLSPRCPRCGTSIRQGAGFCHECGEKVL